MKTLFSIIGKEKNMKIYYADGGQALDYVESQFDGNTFKVDINPNGNSLSVSPFVAIAAGNLARVIGAR